MQNDSHSNISEWLLAMNSRKVMAIQARRKNKKNAKAGQNKKNSRKGPEGKKSTNKSDREKNSDKTQRNLSEPIESDRICGLS